jgi:hypothetical protein
VPRNRPTTHTIRRFTLGSGPLKRTSDRLEYLARVLLVCVLLMATAIALAVATTTYTRSRAEATAQTADRHRVPAQLLEDPSAPRDESDVGRASAVWTEPSGVERKEVISVSRRVKAGSTVAMWVDREGDRTTRPLSDGDVVTVTVVFATLTYIAISMVAFGAYRSFRGLLDRSRSRRWAAEWAVVEPRWTGKVP